MTANPDPTSSQPASEPASAPPENPPGTSTLPEDDDDGVGWLPAIVATCLLIAAAMFVCCGVTTYSLFQKRTELAARTLSGHTIPTIEQSQLDPEDKQALIKTLSAVVSDAEQGRLENWQASGVMNRLTRIPILEWGDLAAIEAMIQSRDDFDEVAKAEASKQISRLRKAILSDQLTIFAINDVLTPILQDDDSLRGQHLTPNPSSEVLMEIVTRSRLTADNNNIEDAPLEAGSIVEWVQQEVAAGRTEGSR